MERYWVFGLVMALAMAMFISLYASPEPDGLEKVAEDLGFLEHGEGKGVIESPMPDYVIPGLGNETVAASLAGLIGTVMVFGIGIGAGRILRKESGA